MPSAFRRARARRSPLPAPGRTPATLRAVVLTVVTALLLAGTPAGAATAVTATGARAAVRAAGTEPTTAPLVVDDFRVDAGATATAPQPAADPAYGADRAYTAATPTGTLALAAPYRCASDVLDCPDAAATFVLGNLRLTTPVEVVGFDVPPVVEYFTDPGAGAGSRTSDAASAVAVRVRFQMPLEGGGVGLGAGTTGTLDLRVAVVPPTTGGPQSAQATVTPSPAAPGALPLRVRVQTEFPVNLATTTALAWERASYLSGVDDGVESPTNTARVTSVLTGDPADALTVSWPAAPDARPGAGSAGMLLDLTGASVTAWPQGAATGRLTGWTWGGGAAAPVQVDLGTVTAPADGAPTGDLLAAVPAATRAALTGLRLQYRAADGGVIERGARSELTVAVREHGSVQSTPRTRSGQAVDYVTDVPAAAFDPASDLNTLPVSGTATTTATRGSVTAPPTSDTRSFRVYDPRAYAGSATTLGGLDGGTVFGGGLVRATAGGTNWSRRAVEELQVRVRPEQADIDAANAGVDPDVPALDPAVLADGLTFAGFGASRTAGGLGDGTGAVVSGLGGAGARLRLTVTTAQGTSAPVDLDATSGSPVLPTDPTALGLTSWSEVTGFTVTLAGTAPGAGVPMGASVTLPYLLRAASTDQARTYSDHTVARAVLGTDRSALVPRSTRSGNRPVTAATLPVAVPRVGVDATKQVVEPYTSTAPGSPVTVVLGVQAQRGDSGHLPDTLLAEDSARATSGSTTGAAWWDVFRPVAVAPPAGVTTRLEYYTADDPSWRTYTGDLATLTGTADWRGLRLVHTHPGAAFDDLETVRTRVTFAVRDGVAASRWGVPDGGTATTRTNVLVATATLALDDHTVTSPVVGRTASTTAVAPAADGGAHALVKTIALPASRVEGTGQSATATLTWGTAGGGYGSVVVADGNDLSDGDATPATGRDASFWDTFDLTGVGPITSGPARAGAGTAYDPYLAFDAVTDVQVYDATSGAAGWHSLATERWTGTAWVPWAPRDGARGDVTVTGGGLPAFPYAGGFPGLTLRSTLASRVGGVRLVYAPRDDAARAAAVAGDWRAALLPLPTGVVAPTDGPAREVKLQVALRDTSRETGEPVNNAFAYTGSTAGAVTNTGRVTGHTAGDGTADATDLGGPVNPATDRTFPITAAALNVTVTKTWQRVPNGRPLTGSALSDLAMPVAGTDAPDADWPAPVATVTVRNASTTRVDALTLTEPAGIDQPGATLSPSDPFARFALTDVAGLTDLSASGASSTEVVLYRWTAGGGVRADTPVTVAQALGASEQDLATVVGLQVRYRGRIAGNASATLTLGTRLLPHERTGGDAAAAGLTVRNTAAARVEDARVCAGEGSGPLTTCAATAPVTRTASADVRVTAPAVEAFGAVTLLPVDVQRDAADPAVTAAMSVQNFGVSDADELLVSDADPRFFNAVRVGRVTLDRLPTGAETAGLEVLVAGDGLQIGQDGTYDGARDWQSWGERAAGAWDLDALAADHGTTADQVVAVRVRFRDTDGVRIAAPGQGVGSVTMLGRLRDELLTGGLPSAVGAEGWRYAAAAELATNPGETVRGRVSTAVTAVAVRDGLTGAAPNRTADVTLSVHAGAPTLRVQKQEVDARGRAPGDLVQYRIEVTNTASGASAADLTGLRVTDVLPEDGSLRYGDAPGGGRPWAVTGSTGGPSPLAEPTVTATADEVVLAWGADERLAPGQGVVVLLWLRVATDLSSTTVVNVAHATSVSRPPVAAPTGADGGTACEPGRFDAASASCAASASALAIGGANVYVSEEWVRSVGAAPVRTTGGSAGCTPRGTGAGDRDWYRYPCAVAAQAGTSTQWQVQVTSRATVATDRLEMVDMLSQVGDYPAMDGSGASSRGSAWRPVWDGTVPAFAGAVPAGANVAVYTTTADYRAGALPASAAFDPVPGTWSPAPLTPGTTVPADVAARVTGFKFVVSFARADLLSSGESVRMQWSMRAPLAGATGGTDAWNSFAFRVPADATAGRPVDVTSVPLKAGARYARAAGGAPTVAVGDRVWLDRDRDGVQGPGEDGVGGVVVDLYTVDGTGSTWAGETTSDPDAAWLLDGLPAGRYALRYTLPPALAAQHRFTGADATLDDVDSDAVPDAPGAATALVADVDLTADDAGLMVAVADMPAAWQARHPGLVASFVDATRDAGLQVRPLAVGDHVWFDTDRDGVQGPGEDPAPGVTVRLLDDASGAVLATTTTDARGAYLFDRLDPGTYRVRVELPDALADRWTFTRTGAGTPATDSDVLDGGGRAGTSAAFALTPAVAGRMVAVADLVGDPVYAGRDADYADPTVDAGLAERPVRVGDRVWVDLDGDGVQDAGEPGLPGVVLVLTAPGGAPVTDAAGQPVAPVTSAADGSYGFDGLLPGSYTVTVDAAASAGVLAAYRPAPSGGADPATDSSDGSATSAVLVGGQADDTLDFGFRPLRALGDTVWFDTDRDGVQDVGEPGVPGAEVRLLDAADGTVLATTTTDTDGRYRFDLLDPGTYRVEVRLAPADADRWTATALRAGDRADADSDVEADPDDPAVVRTGAVTVGPGQPGERPATAADGVTATLVDPTWDAGLRERPTAVGDLVWADDDRDGVQDPGEPGIPGVVVELRTPDGHPVTDAAGRPVGPVTTDSGGRYRFAGLLPGSYQVRLDRIASARALRGYTPTAAGAGGDPARDSSTWTAGSRVLVGGESDETLDFGMVLADDVQLALRKTAVARTADSITWDVTVASTGTQDAYAGFSVVDALPGSLRFTSASGDGFSCTADDRVVRCDHDEVLAAGESATVRIVTGLTARDADVTNTATVDVDGRGYRFQVLAAQDVAWSEPGPAPRGTGPLAVTGASPAVPFGAAAVLLLLGGVLLALRRGGRPRVRGAHRG